MVRYGALLVLIPALTLSGCDGPDPVDAGLTRGFWSEVKGHVLPLMEAEREQILAAAEGLDRLSTNGVDPKVVECSRGMAAIYRRMWKFKQDAFDRGRRGEGLLSSNRSEIDSLVADGNRMVERFTETDKYVRATYP